ncbi:uncharacterized protein LOC62_03G004136 [Vanrija pseudolonga]|uniref:Uncharacterized protein n=1 Tax=Vanrija pseudolonga TaxID=143232 RepID=A0AAF1BK43_9TREE|nr:hypothetical protein LOC62_03G004136 [Vanrija pseudolonga]
MTAALTTTRRYHQLDPNNNYHPRLDHLPPTRTSPHHFHHHSSVSPLAHMDKLDTLELSPGKGLGLFRLGDTLWHVLDILRSRKTEVPKIEVSWDPDNAHKTAVTVHAGPVALLFPASREQRLALIHVVLGEQQHLTLTYQGQVLASRSHQLTRAGVSRALGPTFGTTGAARLSYPGVGFELAPAGGREDLVVAVNVSPREEGVLPTIEPLAQCVLKPGRGATLYIPHAVEIVLGETTSQDLLVDLGPPLRTYWKEDDRLDRVWGQERDADANGQEADTSNSCFWNYFQHGLDFLVTDGVVTKLIAYSNIPGTPQFQQYARCPWVVNSDAIELDFTSPLSSFRTHLSGATPAAAPPPSSHLTVESEGPSRTGTPAGKKKNKSRSQTPSEAPTVATTTTRAAPADVPADAMVLDRTVEGGLDGVVGMGSSQLVGFDGLIVEVDDRSGGISSVQVWWRDDDA